MAYHSLHCCPRGCLKCSQGKCAEVLCRFVIWRMVRAADWCTPCFNVAAIAAPARLLSNEEAHVVVRMISGLKASCTEHTTVVESAIPATWTQWMSDRNCLVKPYILTCNGSTPLPS